MPFVKIKFAASQPTWTKVCVSESTYRDLFLTGKLVDQLVAYIWPANSKILYDCEARQWLTAESMTPLPSRFEAAARTMTMADRQNVVSIVANCINYRDKK